MKTDKFQFLTGASIIGFAFTLLSSPAWGFNLTINPPPTLTLDGLDISEGQFNLTEATGFFLDAGGTILGSSTGNNCPPSIVNPHGGGGGTPPVQCVAVPESNTTLSLLAMGLIGIGLLLKHKP